VATRAESAGTARGTQPLRRTAAAAATALRCEQQLACTHSFQPVYALPQAPRLPGTGTAAHLYRSTHVHMHRSTDAPGNRDRAELRLRAKLRCSAP